MRVLSFVVLAVALAASAILVACGDDDDGGPSNGTPASTLTAGTPGARPQPTSFPTPLIEDGTLRSPGKGYVAEIPDGWNFRANLIQTADASADVMYAPLEPGASAQASIAINCIHLRPAPVEDRISFHATNTARIGVNKDIVQSQIDFAGFDATALTYRFESEANPDQRLDKQDIIFAGENCDWVITFATPVGQFDRYQSAFDGFADSFEETEPTA